MRSVLFAVTLLISGAASAMNFGLGHAVASEGGKVIRQAEDVSPTQRTGDNAAESLPSCGSTAPYAQLPTDLANVTAIVPLGAVNPSGHTLPTDHIYFYLKPVDPLQPSGTRVTTTLVAPADIIVTEVSVTQYISAPTPFSDYAVYFYACREAKSYYSHIQADSALLARTGPIDKNCTTYGTGGTNFRACRETVNVPMSAGEVIGTSGAPYSSAFDFGTFDLRHSVNVVNHARRPYDSDHTVCPVDYFQSAPKSQMQALLGRFDGGFPRVAAPVCGDIGYDVAGTARGNWYKPGAPDNPEDPHLALIPNNVDPTFQNISCGVSVPGLVAAPMFHQVASGHVNRDFAGVTPDGNVYCYDSFYDPVGQPASPGYRVLLSMPSATTIQVERDGSAVSCGSGSWSLSGAAVTFQR